MLRLRSDEASTAHSCLSLVLELDLEKTCLRGCSGWMQAPEKIMRLRRDAEPWFAMACKSRFSPAPYNDILIDWRAIDR